MKQNIGLSTIIVHDYDVAIDFYVQKLGFRLMEDSFIESENKRWVVVAPAGARGTALLLARAEGQQQIDALGNQTGGRVAFFLYTDDFWRDFKRYADNGVTFVRQPVEQRYGTVAVFEDISGNLWDLIEPASET